MRSLKLPFCHLNMLPLAPSQVIVPGAELQEIIPAARLLQTATSLTPVEYERAKQAFLSAVKATKIEAQV